MSFTKQFLIKVVGIVAVLTLCLGVSVSFTDNNKSNAAEKIEPTEVIVVEKEQKESVITSTIEDANYVYITNAETNIYSQPGGNLLGTLGSGVSITVRPTDENDKDGYGWVKEFKGWCSMSTLTKVPLSEVIGVAYTGLEGKGAPCYDKLDASSEVIMLEPYSAYTVAPILYKGNFVKIGDNAYVNTSDIIIDWYQKDYYNREVLKPVSRGYVDRYRNTIVKPISYDISQPSGLTPADFNYITEGTGLEGLGYAFYDIETKNGVNGVFALSVAQLESGHGTSYMAKADNNCFGMMGLSFSSKEDGVKYFGNLIEKGYFEKGLSTIEDINSVYCPPNSDWAPMVRDLMNKNFSKVQ